MAKKKKRSPSITGLGVGLIGSTVAVGSIPNVSGSAAETSIKGSAIQGYGNVASKLPVLGKVAGAGLVIGAVRKLKKKSKKLTRRSL